MAKLSYRHIEKDKTTLYKVLRDVLTGKVADVSVSPPVLVDEAAADRNKYDIPLSDLACPYLYLADVPDGLPAGEYIEEVYDNGGATASNENQLLHDGGRLLWSGSDRMDFASRLAFLDAAVTSRLAAAGYTAPPTAEANGSAAATAVLATPANKLATDASGYVTPIASLVAALAAAAATAVLAENVDSTETEAVTLRKAVEAILAFAGGNSTNTDGDVKFFGRDGETAVLEATAAGDGNRTGSTVN